MKRLKFSIDIHASKQKIWDTLWDDATYRKWTSAFSEGSYAVSDWKEGDKILFLGSTGEGMYSIINSNINNEFMSFKHLGVVKDGIEQPLDEETKKWSGATENYALIENGDLTTLNVELDSTDEHYDYFEKTFPKALAIVKEIAEG